MTGSILLLPRRDRLHMALPQHPLWAALGRADRLPDASGDLADPALAAFDVVPARFATAAVTRHADVGDAGLDTWLRADPCWLQPDMSSLRMMACGDMQLSAADAEDLAAVLRPLFGDAGVELSMPHPARWYLKLPLGSETPRFSPPIDVLGDDVERHIPEGSSGQRWRRLLNEAQMSLHQHRINLRREAAGLAPVNSVWFWGGGRLPNRVKPLRARMFSDDAVLRGLATQAAVPIAVPPDSLTLVARPGDSVFDLRLVPADVLATHWLEPALALLRTARVEDWLVRFGGGESFLLRRGHRWRFWRAPLAPMPARDKGHA